MQARQKTQPVKSLQHSKAPAQDNLKAALELAAEILLPLFTTIWAGKVIPTDWTEGIVVKILKKRALNNCNNWRGITLLSIPSKILGKIIIQRLHDAVDQQLREEKRASRRVEDA